MKTYGNPSTPIYPSTFGPAYDRATDGQALDNQLGDIAKLMEEAHQRDEWLTLREISYRTGHGESSVSAQLRHLRKPEFGSHTVLKRRRVDEEGTNKRAWEYLVIPNRGTLADFLNDSEGL